MHTVVEQGSPVLDHAELKRSRSLQAYRTGPLAGFLAALPALDVGRAGGAQPEGAAPVAPDASQAVVFAGYRLQDIANYRLALQTWFRAVRPGGHLVLAVPHAFLYERQNALPSRWSLAQRRLYTPASLSGEIEEALEPNSYRLRWLGDADAGYDYARGPADPPVGQHDVVAVVEKIAAPAWSLSERPVPAKAAPDHAFEPPRTRVEAAMTEPRSRILLLKLDHLGDFIMGVPALEKARAAFPDAAITLVVGSWNLAMALELGLFEQVVAFDAFPRNSSEERADVRGKLSAFDALVTDEFDLAVDLRTDPDTRILLSNVRARTKAGIGTKAQFEYLDIFLPIDASRRWEAAWVQEVAAHEFSNRGYCERNPYEIACKAGPVTEGGAIIWGPYRRLNAGRYIFEAHAAIEWTPPGVLRVDVALDQEPVVESVFGGGGVPPLQFHVERDDSAVEFRFWPVGEEPVPRFQFYGGRLLKQGASSVLHQSEYLSMLVELVAMRVDRFGVLRDWPAVA